jgi:hypothetical protein
MLPFLPESVPKNLPQSIIQSTGWVQQVPAREESTDSQLFLQRNTSHGYFETQEHPRITSNAPLNTPTFAHPSLCYGFILNQQPAPSMSLFAASTQSPPCYIPTKSLQRTLEELGRESSAMNRIAMSPLEFFRMQQLQTPN